MAGQSTTPDPLRWMLGGTPPEPQTWDEPAIDTAPEQPKVDEVKVEAPVYDERGNVRPRGTKGAKPMTYDKRVEIAASDFHEPDGAA